MCAYVYECVCGYKYVYEYVCMYIYICLCVYMYVCCMYVFSLSTKLQLSETHLEKAHLSKTYNKWNT